MGVIDGLLLMKIMLVDRMQRFCGRVIYCRIKSIFKREPRKNKADRRREGCDVAGVKRVKVE